MKLKFRNLTFSGIILSIMVPMISFAQIDVAFNLSRFEGGYNISCNGGSDGSIEAIAVGDNAPFFYQWSNGSTSSTIDSLHAGVYILTVTDFANNILTKRVELLQPNGMSITLRAREYGGGTNISENGGHDGSIESGVDGGTPPYIILGAMEAMKEELVN